MHGEDGIDDSHFPPYETACEARSPLPDRWGLESGGDTKRT